MIRRYLALIAFFAASGIVGAREPDFNTGTSPKYLGGLIVWREPNQTTVSVGGALFGRHVKVTTATPQGPVVTRFSFPSYFHGQPNAPMPGDAPTMLWVDVPREGDLLYIDGELVRGEGKVRFVQSPPLAPGKAYPLRMRTAAKVGETLVVEDRQVLVNAGESARVTFDGSRATAIAVDWKAGE